MRIRLLGVAAAALMFAVPTAHADMVTNGGFELNSSGGTGGAGSFYGWTQSSNWNEYCVAVNSCTSLGMNGVAGSPYNHSGNFGAFLGQVESAAPANGEATLSQSITGLTVGQNYTLTFFLETIGTTTDNALQATFGNSTALNAVNLNLVGWQEYTDVVRATSTSMMLSFSFFNNPGTFGLDDVSVVPGGVIPEPMTVGLLGTSLAAAGFFGRRRKKQA